MLLNLENTILELKSELMDYKLKNNLLIQEITSLKNELAEAKKELNLTDNASNNKIQNQIFKLEKSRNLINNLFQGSSDALAALDIELNLEVTNELFNELFSRISATDIYPGINLITALNEFPELKSRINHACQKALQGKNAAVLIENSINNVDTYCCYELCIHSIYNQHPQMQKLILRIKDLTYHKLEERIRHRQQSEIALSCRTRAIGEMASALAHEINQPLTAIAAYSRSCLFIMSHDWVDDRIKKRLLKPLEKIAVQAELAGEIIHNMKNFMREGNFYVEETDINLLIQDTLSILYYELLDFKLKITLNLMDNLPKIMTNKIHIMQVILNLARNSIEAFTKVSEVNPELTIETTQSEHFIDVHIRDNGPGIPHEFRNKVLNTYFTTKRKGTGIGLGICRTLIEEHGGKLSLHPDSSQGAWFTFTLPINRTDQTTHETS